MFIPPLRDAPSDPNTEIFSPIPRNLPHVLQSEDVFKEASFSLIKHRQIKEIIMMVKFPYPQSKRPGNLRIITKSHIYVHGCRWLNNVMRLVLLLFPFTSAGKDASHRRQSSATV